MTKPPPPPSRVDMKTCKLIWKDLHKTFEEELFFPVSQLITNETLSHWGQYSHDGALAHTLQRMRPRCYFRFLALEQLQLDGPLFTILSECPALVISPVRSVASHSIFCFLSNH